MAKISRRHLLTGSAALGAGVVGTLVFTESAHATPAAVPGHAKIMSVVQHTGNKAQVSANGSTETVAVHGFPAGWQLRPGDLVLVSGAASTTPNTAFPLVTRLVGSVQRSSGQVRVSSAAIELRPQTIQQSAAVGDQNVRGPKYEAYVIENSRDTTLACVALRPTTF
ncbi:twin-arginine translocation signal domain-containing protein [Fodinicola feengrottensis]|uniref:Twin-arginine translocation signal domain-containing protein n=1 Tax=Fodinicola feengrottensis TaxID=435914 RepID=A0ABN2FVR9_9ACTN|nr:twin-arginine translocation signal domain-containing protein [Fodinicola feengrottensis]